MAEDTKLLNQHMQGKLLQLDYDFITSLDPDACCYCLTDQQVQMILGMADYIGWRTRWFSSSGEIDKQTILDLQGGLVDALMNGCCGDTEVIIYRYNGTVLEQSSDGGVTWTPAPLADYRITSTEWPNPNDVGLDNSKCQGADGVIVTLRDKITQTVTEDMGATAILGVIAAALLIFLSEGTTLAISAQVTALVAAILGAGVSAWQAAFTTDVWDHLRCLIFCIMEDDLSIDQAGVDELYASLDTEFTGIVIPTLKGYINAAGPVGLTNMMRSGSGDPDSNCDDCDCPVPCAIEQWTAGWWNAGVYADPPYWGGMIVDSGPDFITIQSGDRGDGQQVIALTTEDGLICCGFTAEFVGGAPTTLHFFNACGDHANYATQVSDDTGPFTHPFTQCFLQMDTGGPYQVKFTIIT